MLEVNSLNLPSHKIAEEADPARAATTKENNISDEQITQSITLPGKQIEESEKNLYLKSGNLTT